MRIPELVKITIENANKVMNLERQIDTEYKYLKAQKRSFSETRFSTLKGNIEDALKYFDALKQQVCELYPQYLDLVPNVNLPKFKR